MKTSTLRQLADSFTEVRHYHLASALLESNPSRQSRERDKACRVATILEAIRFELSARETRSGRTQDAAHRAERYLQRLLEDFLTLGDLEGVRPVPLVAPACAPPGAGFENAASGVGGAADGTPAQADCRQPSRRAAGRPE